MTIIQDGEFKGAIVGTDGNDAIQESGIIFGVQGNDTLSGNDGNDTIYAGKDDDILYGGVGGDFLRGDQGNDTIYGDVGNDTIYGGKGDDVLYSGEGIDILYGSIGSDTFNVKEGDQLPDFVSGDDVLIGNFTVENGIVRAITTPTPVVVPPTPTPIINVPVITTPTPVNVRFPEATSIALPRQTLNLNNGISEIIQVGDKVAIAGTNPVIIKGIDPGDILVFPVSGGRTIVNQYFAPGSTGAINARSPEGVNFLKTVTSAGVQDAFVASVAGPELSPNQIQTFAV